MSTSDCPRRLPLCPGSVALPHGRLLSIAVLAGSDAGAVQMTAVREDGVYILNGRKTFITNGSVAAFYCVAAMTDPDKGTRGMTMFFVEADNPGVTAENHENKMGIRTSDTCDVVFDNCRIPVSVKPY